MRHADEFQEFYQGCYSRIVAMAAALLNDRQGAEDVAQEAFARACIRWSVLGGYDLPEAWVRRVALRLAIDVGRRRQRAARTVARLSAQRQPDAADPAEAMAFTTVGTVLAGLPAREREVLVLHYLADLPVAEIARDCGLPAGTVKARLAAGRRRMEQELARLSEVRA
ncbi:MAG: RNA polymerase sigma factor [Streptosporangiaceae bacterium]